MVSRLDYLEHFLDSVDFVISGRKGSISEDKWLVTNYESSFYNVLEKQLNSQDGRVRFEVIVLLTKLGERAAAARIGEMRLRDNETVGRACLGYLTTIGENDTLVPQLIETLEFSRGNDFRNAALKLGTVGRDEDIPVMRKIYGQVEGEMREQMRDALAKVIDRNPSLKGKKDLLLSIPVFPDEDAFIRFLNSSEDYLNVRYRNSIRPRKAISIETHNNVVRGIRKIRIRLFNEHDNLIHYPEELTDRYNDLVDSLSRAVSDLSSKEIHEDSGVTGMTCEVCGSPMLHGNDGWRCLDCGNVR